MKRLWTVLPVLGIAVIFYVLVMVSLAQQPAATPKAGDPVERYQPDYQPTPPPTPDRPRPSKVLEGYDTIVLGSDRTDARIILTAVSRQPRITLESNRTGERVVIYLTSQGQAVISVNTKARAEAGAGMFVDERGAGKLILSDRGGMHIFDGAELERYGKAGNVGAVPKE